MTGKKDETKARKIGRDDLLSTLPPSGKITLGEAAKKLNADKKTLIKLARELDGEHLLRIRKPLFGETEFWVTRKLVESRHGGIKKDPDGILDLLDRKAGRIKFGDASNRMGVDKTTVGEWAQDLEKRGLIQIRRHFLRDPEVVITKINELRIRILDEKKAKEKSKKKWVLTPQDHILGILESGEKISLKTLARTFNESEKTIEGWAELAPNLFSINYPANVLASPQVELRKKEEKKKTWETQPEPEGKTLSSYNITSDDIPANIKILDTKEDSMPLYVADTPRIGGATEDILKTLALMLTDRISIEVEEISDPKKMRALKNKFHSLAKDLVNENVRAGEEDKRILAGMLLHQTFGIGDMEFLMSDDWLEEVCVNTSHVPLTVYHKRFGWSKTNILLPDERAIYNYASQIGRKVGRGITNLDPILDAHHLTGDRVCASLFPVSSLGNTITIRKFARSPWTITHFISPELRTLSPEIAAFLWTCFQYELNVLVGGGTASGKTSMLNSLCSLIQPTHRIVSIEETREINLPKYLYWNWIPLTTRAPNPEGKGEVSMLDLIVTSLRMRPDRIVVGEVRRREEAEVLFEAMHTGHSVYSTIHADTSRNLKRRLIEPPIEIPSSEIEALHLILIQYRDRRLGARKTFEVAEVIPGQEGKEFDLNYLYRFNPGTNEFIQINESERVIGDLGLHTGLTKDEIRGELKNKELILRWMVENKLESIEDVGRVMDEYYKDADGLLKTVEAKKKPEWK